jgi:predicted transcriptional regulator of viral defense system
MGWIQKASSQVLRRLADQRRRVVAVWRLLIELRRIAQADDAPLPTNQEAEKVLRVLLRTKELVPVAGVRDVYRAESPYASVLPVSEEQVVEEANPVAVFSHLTALAHHGLTDQIPAALYVTGYTPADPQRIPLGTTPEEWTELTIPPPRYPKAIGAVPVNWVRAKGEWDFGHMPSFGQGLPIYVTDPERTLLDALRSPDSSGGITNVLRAWNRARSRISLDRLVKYTEQFGQVVMRQRVGFIIEKMGLSHPKLADWKTALARGGSLKLLAAAPYAPEFSAEWNLSLNVPSAVLAELNDE